MPFCSNCGVKLNDGAKFCFECGTATFVSGAPRTDNVQIQPINNVEESNQKKSLLGDISGVLVSSIKSITDSAKQAVANSQTVSDTNLESQIPIATSNNSKRQQEYAGIILKCPNCGASITQTTAICADCGHRITGQAGVNSVHIFSEQLMVIERTRKKPGFGTVFGATIDPADQKKLSLIRSFPIPNSVDDIYEFMFLAIANIDVALSKSTIMNRYQNSAKFESNLTMPRTISDAWVSKMQQAYQKAQMSFPNDPAFLNIKQFYLDKMNELKIKVN
jgi:hypothetical protein